MAQSRFDNNSQTTREAEAIDRVIKVEVERRHEELYPGGCPLMCEACTRRMLAASQHVTVLS